MRAPPQLQFSGIMNWKSLMSVNLTCERQSFFNLFYNVIKVKARYITWPKSSTKIPFTALSITLAIFHQLLYSNSHYLIYNDFD